MARNESRTSPPEWVILDRSIDQNQNNIIMSLSFDKSETITGTPIPLQTNKERPIIIPSFFIPTNKPTNFSDCQSQSQDVRLCV